MRSDNRRDFVVGQTRMNEVFGRDSFRRHKFVYTSETAHFRPVLNFGEPQMSEKSGGALLLPAQQIWEVSNREMRWSSANYEDPSLRNISRDAQLGECARYAGILGTTRCKSFNEAPAAGWMVALSDGPRYTPAPLETS